MEPLWRTLAPLFPEELEEQFFPAGYEASSTLDRGTRSHLPESHRGRSREKGTIAVRAIVLEEKVIGTRVQNFLVKITLPWNRQGSQRVPGTCCNSMERVRISSRAAGPRTIASRFHGTGCAMKGLGLQAQDPKMYEYCHAHMERSGKTGRRLSGPFIGIAHCGRNNNMTGETSRQY